MADLLALGRELPWREAAGRWGGQWPGWNERLRGPSSPLICPESLHLQFDIIYIMRNYRWARERKPLLLFQELPSAGMSGN